MRGHIRRRGKRSWAVVLEAGRDPTTGKRRQKWVSVKGTRRDAQQRMTELLRAYDTGTSIEPSKLTVGCYLDRWLADYAAASVRPRTFQRYEIAVRCHLKPTLGAIPLQSLAPGHILDALSYWSTQGRVDRTGGLSPQSCLHNFRILREALGHAVKWRFLVRNPAEDVKAPRVPETEVSIFSDDDLTAILGACRHHELGPAVQFTLFTGVRRGELLGLRWSDINDERRTVHIQQTVYRLNGGEFVFAPPKTQRGRRAIALTRVAEAAIRKQRISQAKRRFQLGPAFIDHDLVFDAGSGVPRDQSNFSRAWKRLLQDAGVKHRAFHTCRHQFATLLLRSGEHPKVVSEALGHSSISVTMDVYSHVMPEMQRDAMDRLDERFSALVASA